MKNNEVNILGTIYKVINKDYKKEKAFVERGIDGYCDGVLHEICICNMKTSPNYESETKEFCNIVEKQILRHEITHAFLNESGLADSAFAYDRSWAKNEEMIDWIANQFPKMVKAMTEMECL